MSQCPPGKGGTRLILEMVKGRLTMTRSFRTLLMTAAMAATMALASGNAHAQKSINVTFISGLPPVTTVVGAAIQTFAPTIDKTLAKTGKYKINWNLAHSGQVVKARGELEGIESGLGDVGIVVTAFHADKAPLYEISYKTPFTTQNLDLVARTVKRLQDQFPEFQAGWKRFNQMNLHPTGTVENYVIISAKPIKTLEDIKGRKIGAAGPNLPWVLALGAAGVQTNVGGAYNSLSTGIFDNMLAWKQAMGAFKLCEPAPYMIDPQLGAVQTGGLNVNLDFFGGLPAEVRAAFVSAAETWHADNVKRVTKGAAKGLGRCKKQFNAKTSMMSAEDRAKWAKMMPNFAKKWAADLDKKKLPGTKVLTTYMDTMRAANQPILRHWDRE